MNGGSTFLWSLRRELWEHRSIWVAPLVVTGFVLLGSLIGVARLPESLGALPVDALAERHAAIVKPFRFAPAPIMLTGWLVGIFVALDALYGERRDRSILFWKSLPVSDRTTVLAKVAVPLAALPLITLALAIATQLVLLVAGSAIFAANGLGPALPWREVEFFGGLPIMVYGLAVHSLWFAPIFAWLLLVSAWARRAPVLWAFVPPLAILALESLASGTRRFGALLAYRFTGAMTEGFGGWERGVMEGWAQLSLVRFLTAPGLWLGLLAAAVFIAGAIRLRRNREPI